MRKLLMTLVLALVCGTCLQAQTVQDSSYRTIGYVKSDGTVQDGMYRTIGHIKSDGTVQDSSYRTIGHAKGVSTMNAAVLFFFDMLK